MVIAAAIEHDHIQTIDRLGLFDQSRANLAPLSQSIRILDDHQYVHTIIIQSLTDSLQQRYTHCI